MEEQTEVVVQVVLNRKKTEKGSWTTEPIEFVSEGADELPQETFCAGSASPPCHRRRLVHARARMP